MAISYFTDQFLARLKQSISVNLANYAASADWIDAFAAGQRYSRETGVDSGEIGNLRLPDDGGYHEAENAIRIHSALRAITPVQATDERLWALMAHCVWGEYMSKRWPVDPAAPDKASNLVVRRYFFQGRGLSGLALNGISRLWWAAHMTYDADRDDPYELTRVFLSRADIVTGLMERSIGKNRILLRFFVEFLRDNMSEIEEKWSGSGGPGRAVQQMARELNRRGAVVVLDAAPRDQIHQMMRRAMDSVPPA